MIQIKKKKLTKKQIAIIATASVVLFLTVALIIVNAIVGSISSGNGEGSSVAPPEVLEGEGIANNRAVAYPYVEKGKMLIIDVDNHNDSFMILRGGNAEQGYDNYFSLVYTNENGDDVPYYPAIISQDKGQNYTDFYAIDPSNGYNMYKLDYLAASIGALYFNERISLSADATEKSAELNRYGLSEEERETVSFSYLAPENEAEKASESNPVVQKKHVIYIGDKLISGKGYYFMIAGRDYVYTSYSSSSFDYLLGDFESFLHSRVVAEGLAQDGLYEPYLTTDYKQWTNKYYGISTGNEGMPVKDGSEVIVLADVLSPVYKPDGQIPDGKHDGYRTNGYTVMAVDLAYINGQPQFDRLVKLLSASSIGECPEEMVASVITNTNAAELGSKYTYTILSVESVLSENKEHENEGYPVGDNNIIKVTYGYDVDGVNQNIELCHGIINLSDARIPEEIRATLAAAKVGDIFTDEAKLEFSLTYDEQNAVKRSIDLIITEISLITKINTRGGIDYQEKVTENSIVTYSYKYVIDGSGIISEGTSTVDLSAITEGQNLEIKNAILGMGICEGIELKVLGEEIYCQIFSDFITYRIKTVKGFVEKEMVVSFEFENASKRDPFYSESIYKNTLENENKYYALDAGACQDVTFLLGGVGGSNSSQVSAGLSGSKTVAVGLTPANMDKFGLYEGYTIYFELPRIINAIADPTNPGIDDYTHFHTLGFYLYISRETPDGTRYIGSDMYDIIVEIDGKGFEFLEKDFEGYWSRSNLVIVDAGIVDKVTVELGMQDVYGKYEFDLTHTPIYILDGKHYYEKPAGGGSEYNEVSVLVSALSDEISDSEFAKILAADGDRSVKLNNLYERVTGKKTSVGHDTEATSNFKEFLRLIYGVNYEGVLTDEEKAKVSEDNLIMSITFNIDSTSHGYSYDFYRVSDRRVMVDLYRVDSEGNRLDSSSDDMSGFYISTFGAKKIINSITTLLNAGTVDPDLAYWD